MSCKVCVMSRNVVVMFRNVKVSLTKVSCAFEKRYWEFETLTGMKSVQTPEQPYIRRYPGRVKEKEPILLSFVKRINRLSELY